MDMNKYETAFFLGKVCSGFNNVLGFLLRKGSAFLQTVFRRRHKGLLAILLQNTVD